MTDEQREINRRVAKCLGWEINTGTYKSTWGEVPCYTLIRGDGSAVLGMCGNVWGWGRCSNEEDAWAQVPDFCTDPAAADLVRLEIERKGRTLYEASMPGPMPGTRRYFADVDLLTAQRSHDDSRGRGYALCLAFLAACGATEKEGGEG